MWLPCHPHATKPARRPLIPLSIAHRHRQGLLIVRSDPALDNRQPCHVGAALVAALPPPRHQTPTAPPHPPVIPQPAPPEHPTPHRHSPPALSCRGSPCGCPATPTPPNPHGAPSPPVIPQRSPRPRKTKSPCRTGASPLPTHPVRRTLQGMNTEQTFPGNRRPIPARPRSRPGRPICPDVSAKMVNSAHPFPVNNPVP